MTKNIHKKKSSELIPMSLFFLIYLGVLSYFLISTSLELSVSILTISTIFFTVLVVILNLVTFSQKTRFILSVFTTLIFAAKSLFGLYLFTENPLFDMKKILIVLISLFGLSLLNLIISLLIIPSEE